MRRRRTAVLSILPTRRVPGATRHDVTSFRGFGAWVSPSLLAWSGNEGVPSAVSNRISLSSWPSADVFRSHWDSHPIRRKAFGVLGSFAIDPRHVAKARKRQCDDATTAAPQAQSRSNSKRDFLLARRILSKTDRAVGIGGQVGDHLKSARAISGAYIMTPSLLLEEVFAGSTGWVFRNLACDAGGISATTHITQLRCRDVKSTDHHE